ncbi:MAG: hypothetical protein QOD14_716, partial [Solirubrobacterales bacterium]|nr:hypothetical protein [Solirubrobacterales bacterium]
PRGSGANAPAHGRLGRCVADAWMVGQAEVVVGAEQQDRLAVEEHRRSLRAVDQAKAPAQPALIEFLEKFA